VRRGPVEIHIEELVLHGFPRRGGYAVGEAVRRELARLGPSVRGSPTAEQLGARIEASVGRAVGSGRMKP
jgi:hypothetical protein